MTRAESSSSEALRQGLPPALHERVLALSDGMVEGDFVLVWMRTALRAHHNPALDVALAVADAIDRPVFVYQGLSERYPYASDRHHSFILEGARDVHRDLAARGIASALHVERPGHTGPHLRTLAERAALVVTEDLPVPPLTAWTARLRDQVSTAVWAVDTACILPMRLSRRPDRAFRFRKATARAREERLDAGWEDRPVRHEARRPALPFEPVNIEDINIPELVTQCRIDHGVGPVPHTPGGTVAGQARWAAFRDGGGLRAYARVRNAAHRDGVSRMSAYLHYGMVSPFSLAQDAAAHDTDGARKWLDEFLVWRELAHAWCAQTARIHRLDVLPDWALVTLARHEGDPRPALPSWETLSRGRTGDALWDLAQQSLLRHGELHNNLRMTWGKQLLQWTPDAETARRMLVDLNHRYALDGRDPCSYGGLYWCLGLFDRPFSPERPVLGTIRPRSTADHARRVPRDQLRARVLRPTGAKRLRVAVVGAGMAGLSCARVLADHGVDVEVFDKSRGPSGRMSTRRVSDPAVQADHGAQFFTVRDPHFRRHVESWVQDGVVAPWEVTVRRLDRRGQDAGEPLPVVPRFVGTPRMSALGRHLARGLRLHTSVRITGLSEGAAGWELTDENGGAHGSFDQVVVAVPAPQAVPLLAARPALQERAARAELLPCQALMVAFAAPLGLDWAAAELAGGPLAWVARDSSKPGRPPGEVWVAHSSPEHAAAHLEDDPETTRARLLQAFRELTGCQQPPLWSTAHRWRYARPAAAAPGGPSSALDDGLGICGDWLVGPRVEAAWCSGRALAGRILGTVPSSRETGPRQREPAAQLRLL
jgi:hypothetical protein